MNMQRTTSFSSSLHNLGLALIVFVALSIAAVAQTFTVIHDFGGLDGSFPQGNLAMDGAGNIYGTTRSGAAFGTVYKLSYNNGWALATLDKFPANGVDGGDPRGGVVIGRNGTLYGTTNSGGNGCPGGCGTIFNLRPSHTTSPLLALAPWNEMVLHAFEGPPDGEGPSYAALVFDQSGAAYGTTPYGGNESVCAGNGCGTVYKLTGSGEHWTESVIYAFEGDSDGAQPNGGVVFDAAGSLFGTTSQGGQAGYGTVFELTPFGNGWTKTVIHQFLGADDGALPEAALLRDSAGNFFGTTAGGQYALGTIFEISPSENGWTYTVLHRFAGPGLFDSYAPLTMDSAGNLYGTTYEGGTDGFGVVFELTPSGNGWTYTVLHNFTGLTDGAFPRSPVLTAPNGVLFGAAYSGGNLHLCGNGGCGVIWEITP